ncbi:hypothetical protein GWK90_04985 [Candidatus Hamiltonella defensa]|uniref:Uncharacterized protein n=3 Tax=aphid secondary symbionts TaxID=146507 RepID=A0A2D3SXV0_9ENTR|nr:hypothetical protein HDEF_1601 [Candidatus Hamiltonella defensa 5AT (Acyrthosiphon pisum)]ASV34072.1 hypothetical protein CJJ18_08940 [Candidatus Hamiltonella defensa]ATW22794.1 hypothetical protein BJP44_07035 [Candidatus Hamiltonella defensa]ATW33925.1 hypothetical protein BJP43_06215 [Candidatus Hamiltonella defensa]AWK17029.1 hypothetical protein CCS40_08760 [Candidatus Hamiltonella defensa]
MLNVHVQKIKDQDFRIDHMKEEVFSKNIAYFQQIPEKIKKTGGDFLNLPADYDTYFLETDHKMDEFLLNFKNELKDRKHENVTLSEEKEEIHRKFEAAIEAALFEVEIVLKENQDKLQVQEIEDLINVLAANKNDGIPLLKESVSGFSGVDTYFIPANNDSSFSSVNDNDNYLLTFVSLS